MAAKKAATRVRRRPRIVGSSLAGSTPSESGAGAVVHIKKDAGRQVIKALVIEGEPPMGGGMSHAMTDDPFKSLLADKTILSPPLDPRLLTTLWENNSILGPCLSTMVVNCEAFGYRFIPRIDVNDKTSPAIRKRMDAEKIILENFFTNADIEGDDSFTGLRMKKRQDEEALGYAGWEVIEDRRGDILGLNYLPGHTLRMTALEGRRIATPRKMLVRDASGELGYAERRVWRRFRRFVQVRGSRMVWFKQFGDPRTMDWRTGNYVGRDIDLKPQYRANSVILFNLHTPRTPYGLPRYIGNLLGLYGSRAADEINYFTFESNNIPSMVVTVSNGMISDGSVDRIQEFVEKQIQGQRNYSRFLILEAEPASDGIGDPGRVGIDVTPLTKEQRDDAMFVNYKKGSKGDVRQAYRLPDLFFGEVPEGGAVGAMSVQRALTDEQVFLPERNLFDDKINRTILPRLGIVYHSFRSNTPETTDNKDLIRILAMSERSGGVTPRIAREVLSQVVGRDLGPVEQIPADIPYTLQIASAQKNQGDPMSVTSVAGTNALRREGAATRSELGLEKSVDGDGAVDSVDGELLIAGLNALREKLVKEREVRRKAVTRERKRPVCKDDDEE